MFLQFVSHEFTESLGKKFTQSSLRMEARMFTDRQIRNMKPGSKIKDTREGLGFGIRVKPDGTKIFFYGYDSPVTGKRRFLTLGEYPELSLEDARIKHGEAFKTVKGGGDPLEVAQQELEVRKAELTFDEVAKGYIAENVEGQLVDNSVYTIKRILLAVGKNGAPTPLDDFKDWRSRKVSTISTEDAAKLLKAICTRSPASARNIIKTARPMFTYALARKMVQTNPFILAGVKSFLSKPVQRMLEPTVKTRTLSEDEIRYLWGALSTAKADTGTTDALRLMLLTGQRPSEVLGLHSDEITGNWWTLPKERAKARLDKNRVDHNIFLVPEALQLIGTKKGFIFVSPVKNKAGSPVDEEPIAINSVGHMIEENNGYFGLSPWGAHDLRRTCRTFMSDIDGITAKAAEATLNHAKEGTMKNYDHHKYLRQIENALTLWRDKLVEIIGGPLVPELPANVIPITRKTAS